MSISVTGGVTFSGGSLFTVLGVPTDAQFNYVAALFSGEGTNTAQNNTFLDGSTNNFSITRNGTTTQGSFSPYGVNWSNYFDGSTSNYLTAPSPSSAFQFSGAFTVEAWVYVTATSNSQILDTRSSGGSGGGFDFGIFATTLYPYVAFGVSATVYSTSTALSVGTWNHVALVRNSSNQIYIYINGVGTLVTTSSNNFSDGYCTIGTDVGHTVAMTGYISNLRVNNTTAVYTSTFTPSTTPLTTISGTSLLTCQSNRFADSSTNNFALTVSGTPSIQRYNPFGTATTYSTSVIGGAGYFNGTGDYLNVANNAALNFGTGDFTLECWIYITSFSGNSAILDKRLTAGSVAPWVWYTDTAGKLNFYNSGTNYITTSSFPLNAWTHIVTSRVSGTLYQFINGVSGMTPTSVTANLDTTGSLLIGTSNDASPVYFKGYMSDVRVVKGSGVTSVNVPTAPLTAIANTSLLLNFTNGGVYDNAMMNNTITVGAAQISTTQYKFGSSSISFNGTTSYLTLPNRPNLNMGNGSWTIEMWIYPTGNYTTYNTLFAKRNDITLCAYEGYLNPTNGYLGYYNGTLYTSTTAPTTNAWSHVAYVFDGTNIKIFLNGTSVLSSATSNSDQAVDLYIGVYNRAGTIYDYYYGYIDDLRITKGYARYTSNFTAPTSAFPTLGPNYATAPTTIEYLVVAGGGGGGSATTNNTGMGGGGAGGYRTNTGYAVSTGSAITVTVGAGAAAGGYNGQDSVFGTITSTGGGGGGTYFGAGGYGGKNGGSGGGGSGYSIITPGTGTSGQGNDGGSGYTPTYAGTGGGGGGASAVGSTPTGITGGNGGAGSTSSISGTSNAYAGGGGGGGGGLNSGDGGSGGTGGGGAGGAATNGSTATSGTANTGGGGGGGYYYSGVGGSGGSGIVIIRYPASYNAAASTTGSPSITLAGGYRVYTWTSSGSVTF